MNNFHQKNVKNVEIYLKQEEKEEFLSRPEKLLY